MSCLFDSMHVLLTQHGIYFENSHILRMKITSFMRDNPKYSLGSDTIGDWIKLVAEDMNINSENYIRSMSNASTWGGGMEMAIMSKIFNIQIDVISGSSQKPLAEFNCTGEKVEAKFTLHWSGSHYTPVNKVDL